MGDFCPLARVSAALEELLPGNPRFNLGSQQCSQLLAIDRLRESPSYQDPGEWANMKGETALETLQLFCAQHHK